MPYKGARCKAGNLIITVKAYDTKDEFKFGASELVRTVEKSVERISTNGYRNLSEIAKDLTTQLDEDMFDRYEVPWYEVEITHEGGGFYGTAKINETALS
jgi:hypothetical protein